VCLGEAIFTQEAEIASFAFYYPTSSQAIIAVIVSVDEVSLTQSDCDIINPMMLGRDL
jgi:hypothetical protein